MALAGCGLVSYAILTYLLVTGNIGDKQATAAFHAQVDPRTYQWPMVAFITAFVLNSICLLFERESSKFQLALLACYINFLAGCNDYLSGQGVLPVVMDSWGHAVHIGREVMWMHSTVAMVYLLGIISDFTQQEVYLVMLADIGMILCSVTGHLAETRVVSALLFICSFLCFGYVLHRIWQMFASAIKEAFNETSHASLAAMQKCTMVLWSVFPVVFLINFTGAVPYGQIEWMWTITDVLAKVMFSSSLLQSNFLTIEQRRFIVMRIVEEGNRLQVIQELQDLVEQKERFLNGMSHELRTPLNGIIGLSEAALIGSCGEVNDTLNKTLSTIKTSGSRLLNLINDILDAASMRQRKGQLTIKHEKVQLCRLVDDVLDLCNPLARASVKLVNQVSPTLPAVLGDTGRIIQIFHNLLGNACKFTHSGSITVSALLKHDEVEVAVSDTGIGMPEDKQHCIFEPFEQVDMSTTRKYGGTGLGLTLVKQLVEVHGGTISVKSKPGVGTAFYFTLKVWDGDESSSVVSTAASLRSKGVPGELSSGRLGRGSAQLGSVVLGGRASGTSDAHAGGGSAAAGRPKGSSWSTASSVTSLPIASRSVAGARTLGVVPCPSASGISFKGSQRSGSVHNDLAGGGGGNGGGGGSQAASEKQEADPVALLAQRAKEGGVQVLSVDDDPVNQMVIQNLLSPAGCTITTAMDGQEALEVLSSMDRLPDIILLDVMMPGMSGYEVCRTVRQLYPDSGMPVIMISAKSKEEDIVEGLASGANDYVVKPFGRSEILARMATHLQLHERSWHAGEGDGAGGRRSDAPNPLTPFLSVPGKGGSLPPHMASGMQTTQLFEQVTVVAWQVTNLAELSAAVAVEELAAALTALHVRIDELLDMWELYSPDDPNQDYNVVVSGLHGRNKPHALHSLEFCSALLQAATELPPLRPLARGTSTIGTSARGAPAPLAPRLELACGAHTLSAQGVLVGTVHPVLHVNGPVLHMAVQLMLAAEPGCAHVSHKVKAVAAAATDMLVPAGRMGEHQTYVLKAGPWEAALPTIAAHCHNMSPDPSSVLSVHEVRLSPLQRALMALTHTCPATMLNLMPLPVALEGDEGEKEGGREGDASRKAGADGSQAAARAAADRPASKAGQPVDTGQLEELRREKELLQRQLDDVSEEAGRLADEVDTLTDQLAQAQEALQHATVSLSSEQQQEQSTAVAIPAATSTVLLQQQEQRVRELELQLSVVASELAATRAQLAEAEKKASAWEQLLQRLGRAGQAASSTPGAVMPAASGRGPAPTAAAALAGRLANEASISGVLLGSTSGGGMPQPPWPGSRVLPGTGRSTVVLAYGPEDEAAAGQARAAALMASMAAAVGSGGAYSGSRRSGHSSVIGSPGGRAGAAAEMAAALSPAARQDVQVLLEELGMRELAPRFVDEQVTPELLCVMDDAALRELGVMSVGGRLKLRLAAQALFDVGSS